MRYLFLILLSDPDYKFTSIKVKPVMHYHIKLKTQCGKLKNQRKRTIYKK